MVGVVIEWMLTGYELFGGGDVDVLRSALAPQDRKVLHHDISIYRPRFQFHVDLDELSPPESGLDGMESPVEGDEQLRGSDNYSPPAPQAASLSRDGDVAAPVLDVLVPGMVGWDGREADRAAVEALAAERVAVAAAVREGPAAAGSASGGCERGRGSWARACPWSRTLARAHAWA